MQSNDNIQIENFAEDQQEYSSKGDIINKRILLLFISVVIFLILGISASLYLLGIKAKFVSVQPIGDKRVGEIQSIEEKILYEDNGFSFYYPRSLEMYQAMSDSLFWRSGIAKGKYVNDALVLRKSDKSFSNLVKGDTFIIDLVYYEPIKIHINTIEETIIQLGDRQTALYRIACGVDCIYYAIRYRSNGKYYELLASGAGRESLLRFQKLLKSFSFYDVDIKEWRSYISKGGHYSVRYPSGATFLEKVYTSVDGVRGYSKNNILIMNIKNNSSSGFFKVNFEKIGAMKLDEYVEKNGCSSDMISMTKRFELNREPAIFQSTACGPAGSSNVYIKHNDFIYIIGETWPEDIMLRNFKFID